MKTWTFILLVLVLMGCDSAENPQSTTDPTIAIATSVPTETSQTANESAVTATEIPQPTVASEDAPPTATVTQADVAVDVVDEEQPVADDDTVNVSDSDWSADPDNLPFDSAVWTYQIESVTDGVAAFYAITMTADYLNSRFSYVTQVNDPEMGGGVEAVEMVAIDNTMHMVQSGSDCFSFSAADFDTNTLLQGADNFLSYTNITTAKKGSPFAVEVNGLDTRHYILDERVINAAAALDGGTVSSGNVDVYVHTLSDGREIVVKTVVEGISAVDDVETQVNYRYELAQVNQPVEIELPAGCEALPSADERIYPTYPGAALSADIGTMQVYTSDATVEEVADFYTTEMVALGWTEGSRLDNTGLIQMTFTQADSTITFNITPNPTGAGVQITIIKESE